VAGARGRGGRRAQQLVALLVQACAPAGPAAPAAGQGAVREVCEFILDARGELAAALAPYLPAAER